MPWDTAYSARFSHYARVQYDDSKSDAGWMSCHIVDMCMRLSLAMMLLLLLLVMIEVDHVFVLVSALLQLVRQLLYRRNNPNCKRHCHTRQRSPRRQSHWYSLRHHNRWPVRLWHGEVAPLDPDWTAQLRPDTIEQSNRAILARHGRHHSAGQRAPSHSSRWGHHWTSQWLCGPFCPGMPVPPGWHCSY